MIFFALLFISIHVNLYASNEQRYFIQENGTLTIYKPVNPANVTSLDLLILFGEQLKPNPTPGFLVAAYYYRQDQRARDAQNSVLLSKAQEKITCTTRSSIKKQSRTITREFPCPFCGIIYYERGSLTKHQNGTRNMLPCIPYRKSTKPFKS